MWLFYGRGKSIQSVARFMHRVWKGGWPIEVRSDYWNPTGLPSIIFGLTSCGGRVTEVGSAALVSFWSPEQPINKSGSRAESITSPRAFMEVLDSYRGAAGIRTLAPPILYLEIVLDHDAILASRQPTDVVHIAALPEEPDRAVTKRKEGAAAKMATAKRLRGRAVDGGGRLIDPPHDVADPNRSVPKAGHARPDRCPLAGFWIEITLADRQSVRGAVGDLHNTNLAVLKHDAAHVLVHEEERVGDGARNGAIVRHAVVQAFGIEVRGRVGGA